jgi:hypothetical protein
MRNCRACQHAERPAIEADLRAGLSYRDIARRHNISKDVVSRHRAHVTLHATPALATVTKVIAILDDAERSANFNICLSMVQEARRCAEGLLIQLHHGIERRPETTSY